MKQYARVVFDRKATLNKTGMAKVEIYIYLGNGQKKYVTVKECNPIQWRRYQKSSELIGEVAMYERIIETMVRRGEDMTIANLDVHLGITSKVNKVDAEKKRLQGSATGFIDFIKAEIKKENLALGTLKRRCVTIDAIERYGKLSRFADLSDINVKGFDEFLRMEDPTRTDVCLNNYHKIIKKYARLAYQIGLIPKNPYESPLCKFKRGKCKERKPLTEEELKKVVNLKGLTTGEEHARDLFIFSAYTGLAYADNQSFDFATMTEESNGMYYIIGERVKNGESYYTPILPPAMEVLKKYDFELPKMSNQKMNQFLHLVEARADLNKPMTTHVARHSFATLALNHDTPMEDVAKMMGHTDIATTKIYAKLQNKTIERHAMNMAASISRNLK